MIDGIDLLETQHKSVLMILANKMVKSHNLMEILIEKSGSVDVENDVFFDNIKVMFSIDLFKDKFDKMLMENTLLGSNEYDFED